MKKRYNTPEYAVCTLNESQTADAKEETTTWFRIWEVVVAAGKVQVGGGVRCVGRKFGGSTSTLKQGPGSINWTRRAPELSGNPVDAAKVCRKKNGAMTANTDSRQQPWMALDVRCESSGELGSIN